MKPKAFFPFLLCSLTLLFSSRSPGWCEGESRPNPSLFVEAQVADASDRAYEPAAIWLIDQAKQSVALSMYLVRESAATRLSADSGDPRRLDQPGRDSPPDDFLQR